LKAGTRVRIPLPLFGAKRKTRPVRLSVQDGTLSRCRDGFDSRTGYRWHHEDASGREGGGEGTRTGMLDRRAKARERWSRASAVPVVGGSRSSVWLEHSTVTREVA